MIKKVLQRIIRKMGYDLVRAPQNKSGSAQNIIKKGKSIIEKISPQLMVLNGPLKGLKYPSLNITEAALVPKILGSYESQLHPTIDKITKTDYSDIIDIGCAEGYYAIGFARLMPNTIIHCFDVNESDLEFCQTMARHNNVTNLTYNNLCTTETLINFNFKSKGLVFCDCEGCELELFTPEVIKALENVDVLVELHDIINPVISGEIMNRFQDTHQIRIINNSNIDNSRLESLDKLSKEDREFSILEHRGGLYQNVFMEWAFLTAKTGD